MLGKLHRGQVLHRDLTPVNVFVCDNRHLKLGDFGIVRQQTNQRGIPARTLNASMVPSDMLAAGAPKWRARDDVYQVGQLLAMLVKGDARARVRTGDVRRLPCSDELKEIIYRCIGERRKRYESADEFIQALNRPPAKLAVGNLRTLKGVHLAFTGVLRKTRHGGDSCGPPRRRHHSRHAVHQDHGAGSRPAESVAGRGKGRRTQAHRDQASAGEGPPHHAAG